MNVLSPPRPRILNDALSLARILCAGHLIDGGPALRHACAVAVTLGEHMPDAAPELIAACLLHDAPDYAGQQLAPLVIGRRLGPQVLALILAIDSEHQAMAGYHADPAGALAGIADLAANQPAVFAASAADKAVSFASILRHADQADDAAAYWVGRRSFIAHAPYFRAFADTAAGVVPFSLAVELQRLVARIEAVAE